MKKRAGKARKVILTAVVSVLVIIVALAVTAGIVLHDRIATVSSLKSVGNLRTLNYQQDYYLDKALSSQIDSDKKLFKFISDNLLFGYQLKGSSDEYACSAFTTESENGQYLVGRIFDAPDAMDAISVYTHPENGYASIATTADVLLGIGEVYKIPGDSFWGKATLLAAPYFCVDGVNEKGLSVSALNLDMEETHEDNGKPDLLLTVAIRLLLDRAATVDEAVELLGQYDYHSHHGWTQHLYIADASGKSAAVEWRKGKMKTAESRDCTNFELTSQSSVKKPTGNCDRFDILYDSLKAKPKNSTEDAFRLLKSVNQEITEWSVVYNLTEFTADYAVDSDYKNTIHLSPKDY